MYQRMELKVNLSQSFLFIYYLFMATDMTCKNIWYCIYKAADNHIIDCLEDNLFETDGD